MEIATIAKIWLTAKFCDFADISNLQNLEKFLLKKKSALFIKIIKKKKIFLKDLSKLKTPPFRSSFLFHEA